MVLHRIKVLAICGLILSLLTAPIIGSSSALAADSTGFSGAPSDGTTVDTTRSSFDYQVDAGQKLEDYLYVTNSGTIAQTFTVAAADAFTGNDGAFGFYASDAKMTDVGSWVTFSNQKNQIKITLPPADGVVVPFTLTVPENASAGDHVGGILVSATTAGNGQVKIERRVGTRLYARVRGDINPAFSIANMVARYEPTLNPFDGTMYVSFSMQNTGNISLSADAITKVSGIFGIPLGAEKTIKVPELLPGLGRDVTLKINGIGQWAIFTPTVKMKATISKNALDAGKLPIVTRDTTMVSAPFSWIVLIAFVLSVWLIIRFRINKRNRQMVQWLEYTEAEARRKAQEVAN